MRGNDGEHTQAEQDEQEVYARPPTDGLEYVEHEQWNVEDSEDNGSRQGLDPEVLCIIDRRGHGWGSGGCSWLRLRKG